MAVVFGGRGDGVGFLFGGGEGAWGMIFRLGALALRVIITKDGEDYLHWLTQCRWFLLSLSIVIFEDEVLVWISLH